MTGCGFLYHFQHTSIVSGQKLYPDYERGTKFYDNRSSRIENYNPGQNVWDTLHFRWGKCMQFKLTPTRTLLGGKVKHLLHFLHTIRTSTLFRKGRGEKNCVKAVFIRVSYKFHTWKKIRGGVPKPFWLGREDCFSEISSKCYYLVLFNFGLYKWDQIFGFLACSNE